MISDWFKFSALGLCLTLMSVDIATASVASTTLERISRTANVVAIAQVEKIEVIESSGHARLVAVAKVLNPVKGVKAGQRVAFLAERTWVCDATHAVAGETVLLFLSKPDERVLKERIYKYVDFRAGLKQRLPEIPFFQIAHHGGGRIKILQQDKTDYLVMGADREWGKPNARVYAGYIHTWPTSLSVLAHPDPKVTHLRLVPVAQVKATILTILKAEKAPRRDTPEKK